MAKKGQKINKYSRKFKLKICYDYKYGNLGGYRKVAEKYNISFSIAKNWITLMINMYEYLYHFNKNMLFFYQKLSNL